MAKILVVVEFGKVITIDGIPVDLHVEVRSYDVEGVPESVLSQDENGRACEVREWYAPE